jgi:hypothetical protein
VLPCFKLEAPYIIHREDEIPSPFIRFNFIYQIPIMERCGYFDHAFNLYCFHYNKLINQLQTSYRYNYSILIYKLKIICYFIITAYKNRLPNLCSTICFSYMCLLKYSCVTCNCFFRIACHIAL